MGRGRPSRAEFQVETAPPAAARNEACPPRRHAARTREARPGTVRTSRDWAAVVIRAGGGGWAEAVIRGGEGRDGMRSGKDGPAGRCRGRDVRIGAGRGGAGGTVANRGRGGRAGGRRKSAARPWPRSARTPPAHARRVRGHRSHDRRAHDRQTSGHRARGRCARGCRARGCWGRTRPAPRCCPWQGRDSGGSGGGWVGWGSRSGGRAVRRPSLAPCAPSPGSEISGRSRWSAPRGPGRPCR